MGEACRAAAAHGKALDKSGAPHLIALDKHLLNMNSLDFSNTLSLAAPHAKAMYSKPIIMGTPDWNQKQAANNWCASAAASAHDRPSLFPPPPPSSCPPCRTWNNLQNGSNNLANPNPYNPNAQIWKAY